jgi:hypothetical protein
MSVWVSTCYGDTISYICTNKYAVANLYTNGNMYTNTNAYSNGITNVNTDSNSITNIGFLLSQRGFDTQSTKYCNCAFAYTTFWIS